MRAKNIMTLSCLLLLLLGLAACSDKGADKPQGPFADPWTVMPSSELAPRRGFVVQRGIIHNHSPYSHDACDDEPFIDGVRNEQCFLDVRAGMCESGQDFVFLTDHDKLFAHYEYPEVLLFAAGDTLIERDGLPVANRVNCGDGRSVIVGAGTESAMMPIGIEHHLGDDPAARDAAYDTISAQAVEALQAAGALVFLQHTEGWDVDTILSLPIDGIEVYNLHQNLMENLGAALEMALRLESEPESLPVVELAVITVFQENEADLFRWARAVSEKGRMVGALATDAHRNVFPNPSPDGERLDSFRRMMHWFSNHVLVPAGAVDDRVLKQAIGHGRMYGAFEFLGYPVGFDFRAESEGGIFEMGDEVSATENPELVLRLPSVYRLDPLLDPPTISGRILRAQADGSWEEVARGEAEELRFSADAGVYRAEVRMVPHHLRPWLGNDPDRFIVDTIWIYANPIYVRS